MLIPILILATVALPISEAECNFFQKIWKSECPNDDEITLVTSVKTCSYFDKFFRNNNCDDNEISARNCQLENCHYNPDEDLTVPQMIARHGYPSESHTVVTDDGFILEIHRIPKINGSGPQQPIFLQHGLMGSSADWIINGNQTLAFYLADLGYDVWLGNCRGNIYSRGHVSLPTTHATFWNFSFHEMGTKDLPKVISYITKVTNKPGEIIYIGHSMGTTMFYVFASENPVLAKNVKVMVGMGSAAYMTHIKSPIKYFAPLTTELEWLRKHLDFNEFLPNSKLMKILSSQCELFKIDEKICENLIFAICGFNKEEFNIDILPVLLAKDPAGSSTKTIIHYAQEIDNRGNFQKYDYGSVGNFIEYGTVDPPPYNISNIRNPIYLMYAKNDWLSNPVDVLRFARELKNLAGTYEIEMDSFNHVDYIFGKDAKDLVYKPLYKFLSNYTDY
ncbi:lipase 3-like [Diorhabda sublineata]|uniref:lipase 3-like n=1 Tax=Diorhabda sublineata TaxID=1163346 RepID=UPI0024E15023|nr:lipase 3-like [Diorhabda sublineata]XP_056630986.1 lipase 3-like [Diorhabda sublineata]XP_056630987.1 lipase 3-like [Diorhabda sublineata]